MVNKKLLSVLASIVGFLFIILAILYFAVPAQSLPPLLPGYQAGLLRHHYTHGIASFLLGLVCFAFSWFQTGKQSTK